MTFNLLNGAGSSDARSTVFIEFYIEHGGNLNVYLTMFEYKHSLIVVDDGTQRYKYTADDDRQ